MKDDSLPELKSEASSYPQDSMRSGPVAASQHSNNMSHSWRAGRAAQFSVSIQISAENTYN